MKLIALGTVHGRKLIKAADARNPKSKPKYEDMIAKPGDEIDTDAFGIDDAEALTLIKQGAARRKTREVADDTERTALQPIGINALTDAELKAKMLEQGLLVTEATTRSDMLAALTTA